MSITFLVLGGGGILGLGGGGEMPILVLWPRGFFWKEDLWWTPADPKVRTELTVCSRDITRIHVAHTKEVVRQHASQKGSWAECLIRLSHPFSSTCAHTHVQHTHTHTQRPFSTVWGAQWPREKGTIWTFLGDRRKNSRKLSEIFGVNWLVEIFQERFKSQDFLHQDRQTCDGDCRTFLAVGILTRGNDIRMSRGMTVSSETLHPARRHCTVTQLLCRVFTKKGLSHSRDCPGVTAQLPKSKRDL